MAEESTSDRLNALIDDDYQEIVERIEEEEEEADDDDDEDGETVFSLVSSFFRNGPTKSKKTRQVMKPFANMNGGEKISCIVACVAIVLAFIAMLAEGGVYAVLSWFFSVIMGAYLYYQNISVTNMAIVKETKDALVRDVTLLKGENTRLSYNVDELEGRVEDLIDVEEGTIHKFTRHTYEHLFASCQLTYKIIIINTLIQTGLLLCAALDFIYCANGQSIDTLEEQVKKNTVILKQMEQSTGTNDRVVEALISLIHRKQFDKNNIITIERNSAETRVITEDDITAITRNFNDIMGLYVNEARLKNILIIGRPVSECVMDALQNLSDESSIFKY